VCLPWYSVVYPNGERCFVRLEMAVGSGGMEQAIDLSSVSGKIPFTLLMIRLFCDILEKSIGYARHVLLAAVSRFNGLYC
jgi:hypothetical protein